MVRISGKIRRLLLDAQLVSEADWNGAREKGGGVLETLISSGVLDEDAFLETLGGASGIPPVDLSRINPDPAALELVPHETCSEHAILPLAKNGDILTLAVGDPFDVLLLDDIKRLAKCQIRQVLSNPIAIKRAIDRVFQTNAKQVESLLDQVKTGSELEVKVEEDAKELDLAGAGSGDDAPAVKLINLILLRALKEKASDIHIEPGDKVLRVRFRIDGAMKVVMSPPRVMLNALISRLKILAQLDIAERFTPQDGKFQIRYEGRTIDFRLSVLPVVGGEKAVMRILDQGSLALKLDSMGYEARALADIQRAIDAPYGMLLVTGPTGSGKSTTLYSCVAAIATDDVNVVTVEDPVEYRMDGVNQVPVNPKRGLTFAGAMRSILRQDPDVILVGEIRDTETADIAIKAALTGHLVLSTLHTNDAATTVTRLVDMGVDPYLVSSSLLCIGAQRLGRKLCDQCRLPIELPVAELKSVGFTEALLQDLKLFQPNPKGCGRCHGGYRGRFAILETLYLDETLKRMVVERRSVQDLKAEAVRGGMLTLRQVGLINAARGRTSLEEILRVTMEDDRINS